VPDEISSSFNAATGNEDDSDESLSSNTGASSSGLTTLTERHKNAIRGIRLVVLFFRDRILKEKFARCLLFESTVKQPRTRCFFKRRL